MSKPMQLSRPQRRDTFPPLVNGGALQIERIGQLLAAPVETNGVLSKHATALYGMPSSDARYGKRMPTYPMDMPSDHAMGERIKMLRESRGWSQAELAKRVGVSRATENQWESGRIKNIRLEAVLRLVEVLQTSLRYLVYGAPASSGPSAASRAPSSKNP